MVRNLGRQLEHRKERRKQFFEESNYRKWSDITYINDSEYEGWRDDCFFECYLRNTRFSVYDLNLIEEIFQKGDSLPIHWQNFYAYFDEQFNDENNRYKQEINDCKFYPGGIPNVTDDVRRSKGLTVMQILNKYRDQLLNNNYDII